MKYPIKVLMDKDKKPFIPFVPTSAIVENGTGKTLEEILANLAVPIVNLTSIANDTVSAMMTKMEQYKNIGFSIIYTGADSTGVLFTYSSQTVVDTLNSKWTFVSGFDADGNAYNLHVTGYYNTETKAFTCSNVELVAGISNEVGNLESLNTTDKSSVVNAINEVKTLIDTKVSEIVVIEDSFDLSNYSGTFNIPATGRTKILNAINKHLDIPTLYCLISAVNSTKCMAFFAECFDKPSGGTGSSTYQLPGIIINKSEVYSWSLTVKVQRYSYMSTIASVTFPTSNIAKIATNTYVNDRLKTIDLSAYATTEYVDEQIGNINDILATITTPEVSE